MNVQTAATATNVSASQGMAPSPCGGARGQQVRLSQETKIAHEKRGHRHDGWRSQGLQKYHHST